MAIINFVLCLWIAYVAISFMGARHPPETRQDIILQGILALTFAAFLLAAVMPLGERGIAWWTFGRSVVIAALATWLYHWKFDIRRHVSLLGDWVKGLCK